MGTIEFCRTSFCDGFKIEPINSEQQHLLTQKSSQLEASLETASKFKIYFHQEKDKTDTLEQSIARLR